MVRELLMSQIGSQKKSCNSETKGRPYTRSCDLKSSCTEKEARNKRFRFALSAPRKLQDIFPGARDSNIQKRENRKRTPFYFPTSADYETDGTGIVDFKNKSFSSNSAVIENFSVTYTGKNPYTASKKFLEARLSIKVDNISILFDEKSNGQTNYAPLTDLFTIRTVGKREKSKTILGMQKKNRLHARIGRELQRWSFRHLII